MHKKAIWALIVITFFVFSNSLFNRFVGDDEVIFVNNTFYQSWGHVKSLFSKEYLTQSNALFTSNEVNYHSGSVSYRPVLSTTFFFDYWIWKLNPFGYHLQNVILHIANTLLVYFLIFFILQNQSIAFFSALLFSVHPLKTEPVCSIGYRGDVLACFFVLLSLICFILFTKRHKNRFYLFSLISYFLALFSKESAIALPLFIILYDWYIEKRSIRGLFQNVDLRHSEDERSSDEESHRKEILRFAQNDRKTLFRNSPTSDITRNFVKRYLSYFVISFFYLYVYFYVFPNTALMNATGYLGGNHLNHFLMIAWIFTLYLIWLFLPFSVHVLPALYEPSLHPFFETKVIFSILVIGLFVWSMYKTHHSDRTMSFFLSWFLISFIPISNIVYIANPIAQRFLYLPSVGFYAIVGILLARFTKRMGQLKSFPNFGMILRITLAGLCIIYTYPLNMRWKNNVMVALAWLENYPNDVKSNSILGIEFFKAGMYKEAAPIFSKCIELGTKDPRIYEMMGRCIMYSDPLRAKVYFEKAIEMFPSFISSYFALGVLYFDHGKYKEAISYFEQSLTIQPTAYAYFHIIRGYKNLGQDQQVQAVLEKARTTLESVEFGKLKKSMDENLKINLKKGP